MTINLNDLVDIHSLHQAWGAGYLRRPGAAVATCSSISWPYNIVAGVVGGVLLVFAWVGALVFAYAATADPITPLDCDPDEENRYC